MYAFHHQELGNDQGGLGSQRGEQAIQFHLGKINEYSTPQKLTNSKFIDELAEQEFEIQTFKVDNSQSQSKTRRNNNAKVKRVKNKTNDLSQERSSDSSHGPSNYKQSLESSSSSKQSNQQSDQQKSQEGGSNAGTFSASQQHS